MNFIEHGWATLNERIYILYPDIEFFDRTKNQSKEQFYKVIKDTWKSLGEDYLGSLIRSMESRENAVLEAKGLYTRY